MVYEQTIYQLKGITEHYITTLGSVNLQIQIGSDTRATEFHVVHSSFPVPHEGILGKPFIVGQETIINYQTKELILTDPSVITLEPRAETLIAVQALNIAENLNILIPNQNITESIMCGNVVTSVKDKSVWLTVINPTEQSVIIKIPTLSNLVHEEYKDTYCIGTATH